MRPLTAERRDERLAIYRKDPDPGLRFRAHITLLLGEGHRRDAVEEMLFCSSRTVDRRLKRFQAERVAGPAGRERGRPFRVGLGWVPVLAAWVTTRTPRDFGFLRSRWSCAVPALPLREREGVQTGRGTARRLPHRGDLAYRRPRPVPPPNEGQRRVRLAEPRAALEKLPADETAAWRDEVEVHTDPKIGRMWMPEGRQAEAQARGANKERHLAGSIHRRTGQVFVTEAAPKQGRDSTLLIKHPDDLRRRLRRYEKVHVIRDNAGFRTGHEVIGYL